MRKLVSLFICIVVLAGSEIANANILVNPGFENGNYQGWSRLFGPNGGRFDNVTGSVFGVDPYQGTRMAGAAAQGDVSKHQSHIIQTFTAPVGWEVTLSGWGFAQNFLSDSTTDRQRTRIRIGYSPSGQTDPLASGSDIVWLPFINATGVWEQRSTTYISTNNINTLVVRIVHNNPTGWNLTYVDNFSVTLSNPNEPGPDPIPEPVFFQMGALLAMGGLGMARLRRKN